MTRKQLDDLLAEHGLKVDGGHFPHGEGAQNRFCDLYIGTGQSRERLSYLAGLLRAGGLTAVLTYVTNPEHPDHGKLMLKIESFWNS